MKEYESYSNIIQIIDSFFDEIMQSIISDLESNEQYKEIKFSENILLSDYAYLNNLKQLNTSQQDEFKVEGLVFYIEHLEKKMKIMMKGAYYRGIKDNMLLMQQAGLFKLYQNHLDQQ